MPQHPVYELNIHNLSVAERVTLAQELWDSLHSEAVSAPITEAERLLIRERVRQADAPGAVWYSWEEVKQQLLSRHTPSSENQ